MRQAHRAEEEHGRVWMPHSTGYYGKQQLQQHWSCTNSTWLEREQAAEQSQTMLC